MLGRRALTLDLFLKQILLYRVVESTRTFSTKNANAVTSWRQLKPRAPRKRKQPKEPTTKATNSALASKNTSSSSIQALESTSGPAQREDSNKVPELNKGTEEKSKSKKSKNPPGFKFAPNKKAATTDSKQTQQIEKTSGNVRSADEDGSENEELGVDSRVEWKFHNASFFGCTPGEVTQRVKELSQAGFCNEHIDLLLRRLPPTLRTNSKMVYQNVNSFVKWNIPWKQFVDTNPELLLLEPSQVVKRLEQLNEIGINASSLELRSLLVLMHCDVTQTTVDRIRDCKESKISPADQSKNLHLAISDLSSMRHCDDASKMSLLLKEIGGVPDKNLLKYPYLTYKKLNDVLKVLSGKPLYLDNYQLQHVLTKFPKLLNDAAIDIEELRCHLDNVHDLIPVPIIMQLIRRPNGLRLLFDPKIRLREKVIFLEEQGFSQSQIGCCTSRVNHLFPCIKACQDITTMMSKMTYTFMEDLHVHTGPLIKYFLGLKGASPDIIVRMSGGKGGSFYSQYFSKGLDFVRARIIAAEEHSPALLDVTKLYNLFGTRATAFAKLCGITPDELQYKSPHAISVNSNQAVMTTQSTDAAMGSAEGEGDPEDEN